MNLRRVVVAAIVAAIAVPVSYPAFAADPALPTTDPGVGAGAGIEWLRSQIGEDGAVRGATGLIDYGGTRTVAHALVLSGDEGPHLGAALDVLAGDLSSLSNAGGPVPGAIGQLLEVVAAEDRDPRDFGGVDLIELLISSQRTAPDADAGLFGDQAPTFDGAFRQSVALSGLAKSGDDSQAVVDAIAAGAEWLADQQCADGSWMAYRADTTVVCPPADPATFSGPDSNSTSSATIALQSIDHPMIDPSDYFVSTQGGDGGWAFFAAANQASDSNSTALVIRARHALEAADDPDAVAALLALQLGCDADMADQGSFMYTAAAPAASRLATLDAVPALALLSDDVTPANPCTTETTTTTTTAATSTTTTIEAVTTTSIPDVATTVPVGTTPTAVEAATAQPATPVPASRVTFVG